MESKIVYENLKRLFPNDVENLNIKQLPKNFHSIDQCLNKFLSKRLPQMPLQELHSLCQKQEKNVMRELMEIKQVDIYQQIASVCPEQENLRNLSVEEISRKISMYSQNAEEERSGPGQIIEELSDSENEAGSMLIEEVDYQMLREKDVIQLNMDHLDMDDFPSFQYNHGDYQMNLLDVFDEEKEGQEPDSFFWGQPYHFHH